MIINELQITNVYGNTFSSASCNVDNIYKRTGDKNIYELVIDNLMLVKYSNDIDLMNYIKSLPLHKKRLAILSLMDDDQYSWDKLREKITGNKVSKIDHLKDLVKMFREFIKVAEVERKTHGEIMTPMDELARPMVDLVEKYDEDFWKNPEHKVLDSSAGIGTFLIICAAKFMNGLKDVKGFEDPEVRFKHIVEKCLYYGELQSRNAFLWLCAIDPYDEYKTNTYFGSFLEEDFNIHMKDVWKVDKFDLIIQNPPYQVQQEGFTKTQPIWNLFVEKSIKILNDDKYMVMVHPNGWRNIDGVFKKIQNLIKERQLLEIKIFSDIQAMKYFGASIFFDYYILKNNKNTKEKTTITTPYNETFFSDIDRLEFLPDGNIDDIEKLIAKDGEETVNILHSFSAYETRKDFVSDKQDDNFIYPCISNIYRSEEPKLVYSSINTRGHFGIPKLVCGMASSGTNFFIDRNGDYGLTQFSFAIIDDPNILDDIKTAMKSKDFQRIIESIPNNSSAINFKILRTFKKDFYKNFL